MKPLACVVIDDEPLAANLIVSYIERTPEMKLAGVFAGAQDAVKTVMRGDIDIVFLDIEMPQLNGVEFARIIPRHTRIIFVTAYETHAVHAFRLNALDYLLKPVSYEEFIEAANRAFEWRQLTSRAREAEKRDEFIIVKSEYKHVQIPLRKILYVEGLKDYVKFYLEDQDKSIMSLMSMKALDRALPQERFLRVHRSYIINTSRITVVERNRVFLGAVSVPVSEGYRGIFSQFVNSRLIGNPKDALEEEE